MQNRASKDFLFSDNTIEAVDYLYLYKHSTPLNWRNLNHEDIYQQDGSQTKLLWKRSLLSLCPELQRKVYWV